MEDEIIALIPAFNEENHIRDTVETVAAIAQIDRIIVVDDGSTDSTSQQAKRAGAQVVRFVENRGKGNALNEALHTIPDYKVLLLLDADLGKSAKEAEKLISAVTRGECDLAIAAFPPSGVKGGFGIVKSFAAWGIKKCSGLSVSAPLSGQRAISKSAMQCVERLEDGFGVEVGLTIDVERAGFQICEVPTKMSHAETGRNMAGFLHRGRQFWYVLIALKRRMR